MELPPVPALARELLSRLPVYPPALMCAVVLNAWASRTLNAARLPQLSGKVIAIAVRDCGLRLAFRVHAGGVAACGAVAADATISAEARDFLALALRREDPDTLFFARRLLVEGDTEAGLLVKNTLDALDARELLQPPAPGALLAALRAALGI